MGEIGPDTAVEGGDIVSSAVPEKIHPAQRCCMIVICGVPQDLRQIQSFAGGTDREVAMGILHSQIVQTYADPVRRDSFLEKIVDPIRLTVGQKSSAAGFRTDGIVSHPCSGVRVGRAEKEFCRCRRGKFIAVRLDFPREEIGLQSPNPCLLIKIGEIRIDPVVEIPHVHGIRRHKLFHLSGACDAPGSLPGLVQRRKKHPGKDRNDRNYNYDNLLNIQYGVY